MPISLLLKRSWNSFPSSGQAEFFIVSAFFFSIAFWSQSAFAASPDVTPPTVSSITFSDTALKVGDTATVTIVMSEPVVGFDASDIFTPHGNLSPLSSADNITFTGTFTPDFATESIANTATVGTGFTDIATNSPVSGLTSANYAIDTKIPAINSITFSDTALKTGDTATVTIVMSEPVVGFESLDISTPNGSLGPLSSADNITFTGTFTPTGATQDVTNIATVATTFVDLSGNAPFPGLDSANYEVDTKAPVVSSISLSDMALKIGETSIVTIVMSEPVVGFNSADITVTNGTMGALSTIDGITYTGTFTPTNGIEAPTNTVSVGNGFSDIAGNPAISGVNSSNYAIDTKAPSITGRVISTNNPNGTLAKAGNTVTFTISYSEAVTTVVNIASTANNVTTRTSDINPALSNTDTIVFTVIAGNNGLVTPLTINFTITDVAGNSLLVTNLTPVTGSVTADTAAPITTLVNVTQPAFVEGNVIVTASSTGTPSSVLYSIIRNSDNSTIATGNTVAVDGSFNNVTEAVTSLPIPTAGWLAGSYRVVVLGTDGAGNGEIAASSNALTFTVLSATDTTAPLITPNVVPVSSITQTGANVDFQSNETGMAKVVYGVTGAYGSTTVYQSVTAATAASISLGGLTCGTSYHYSVYGKDGSGNESHTTDAVFATSPCAVGDTSSPTITYNAIANQFNQSTVPTNIVFTLADNTAVTTLTLANGASATNIFGSIAAGTYTLPLSNTLGLHEYVVTAGDAAGNTKSVTITYNVLANSVTNVEITGYTISNLTNSGLTISWTTDGNAGSATNGLVSVVDILGSGFSNLNQSAVITTTDNSLIITGLSGSTNYVLVLKSKIVGQSSYTTLTVPVTTASSGTGVGVTAIQMTKSYAIADNTYGNGWEWKMDVTVNNLLETNLALKFADWKSGTNTLVSGGNMRYGVDLDANGTIDAGEWKDFSTASLGADGYPTAFINIAVIDGNTALGGRQITVIIQTKVPLGTAGGSFSTSYGVKTQ